MKFDTMQHHYPWILELFAAVAEYIHRGNSPDTALARLARDHAITMDRIHHYHLEAITAKLRQFAGAIYTPTPQRPPEQCPCCGSLDITAGACVWCHSKIT